MISLRSFRDPVLVVLSLVAIWQVLHQLAGDSALTAPAPTLAPSLGDGAGSRASCRICARRRWPSPRPC